MLLRLEGLVSISACFVGKKSNENGQLLVSKVFSGAAQQKGILAGDVIRAANNRRITNSAQFEKLIADLPENEKINMLVVRDNRSRYIAIDVP